MEITLTYKTVLVLLIFVSDAISEKILDKGSFRTDMLENSPGSRTFFVSKILLLPTLTALGMKFLLLLPVFLSKLALLGIMNFVATKLNLVLSVMMGIRNYFTGDKKPTWNEDAEIQHEFLYPNNEPMENENVHKFLKFYQNQPSDVYYAITKQVNPVQQKNTLLQYDQTPKKPRHVDQENVKETIRKETLPDNNYPGKYKCYWTQDTKRDIMSRKLDDTKHANQIKTKSAILSVNRNINEKPSFLSGEIYILNKMRPYILRGYKISPR